MDNLDIQRIRKEAKGEVDAILAKYEAEAKDIRQMLDSKAAGQSPLGFSSPTPTLT